MALNQNMDLKISQEHILMGKNARKMAFSQFFPQIEGNASYIRLNKQFQLLDEDFTSQSIIDNLPFPISFLPIPIPIDLSNISLLPSSDTRFGQENNFVFNVGLTQPIFAGGRIFEVYKMSKVGEQIASESAILERQKVLYETEDLYWNIVSIQEKQKVVEAYQKMLQNLEKDVEAYITQGVALRNDLLRVKLKQNEIDLNLFKINNGLKLAKMALCQKIGMDINSDITLSEAEIEIEEKDIVYENIRQSAILNRPELKLLEHSVKLTESALRISTGSFMPTLGFTANYLSVRPNPYRGLADEFGSDYMFGFVMNVPIFHWFEKHHSHALAKNSMNIAKLKLEDSRQKISMETLMISNEILEAKRRIEISKVSLDQTLENLKLIQDSYNEGMMKTAELIEAQAIWQEAQTNYIESKAMYRSLEIKLKKSSGEL
ncbi:MAG: TolC family protein [Bacteroidales bacterium]|nr:TolC family protein [Bacteroidales bacterium]